MQRGKLRQQRAEHVDAEPIGTGNPERPGKALLGAGDPTLNCDGLLFHPLGVGQDDLTLGGENEPVVGPLKEAVANRFLEGPEAASHGGLGKSEGARGRPQGPLARYREEQSNVTPLHSGTHTKTNEQHANSMIFKREPLAHIHVVFAEMEQSKLSTMKALILESPGDTFRVAEIPRPSPAEGEVLVRIKASGVNPLDTKIRSGNAAHARHPVPAILGIDMAGVVEAVGAGVKGLRRGDEVYGMTGGVGGVQGSLAQFASVDARLLARKPSHLSMRQAAALPLVFITAWEGLVDRVGVSAAQKVLVLGGAGGVGHVAVQIAKSFDAEVYAVDGARTADYIRSVGATPIDYASETVEDYVARYTDGKGFDVVYDTIGGPGLDTAFKAVKRFGHVVSCLGWGTHALAPLSFKAATYSGVFTLIPLLTGEGREHHGEIMAEATKLANADKLTPRLDGRVFTLDTVMDAYELIQRGGVDGKLIIDIDR